MATNALKQAAPNGCDRTLGGLERLRVRLGVVEVIYDELDFLGAVSSVNLDVMLGDMLGDMLSEELGVVMDDGDILTVVLDGVLHYNILGDVLGDILHIIAGKIIVRCDLSLGAAVCQLCISARRRGKQKQQK